MSRKTTADPLRSPDPGSEQSNTLSSTSTSMSPGTLRLSPCINAETFRHHNRQNLYNINSKETTIETIMSDDGEVHNDRERFTPVTEFEKPHDAVSVHFTDYKLPESAIGVGRKVGTKNEARVVNLGNNEERHQLEQGSVPSYRTYASSPSTSSSSSSELSDSMPNTVTEELNTVTQGLNTVTQGLNTVTGASNTITGVPNTLTEAPNTITGAPNYFETRSEQDMSEKSDDSNSLSDEPAQIQAQCLPYSSVYDAYYLIELDSNIRETDWVETSYNLKIQDDPENKVLYDRALLTIGLVLKSVSLLNLVLENSDHMMSYYSGDDFGYEDAVKCLKLAGKDGYTEMDVLDNFVTLCLKNETEFSAQNMLTSEVFDNFLYYIIALKLLGERLSSDVISRFLKTGFVDDRLLKNGNWPVGLFNMGNTCYLNSLLQYYFVIKPLKEYILSYKKENILNYKENILSYKKGNNAYGDADLLRCQDFLGEIQKLYREMITTKYKIAVPTNELVYLAFAARGGPGLVDGKLPDMEALEVTLDIGRQQDVTECMLNFIDQIEDTVVGSEGSGQLEEVNKEVFEQLEVKKGGSELKEVNKDGSVVKEVNKGGSEVKEVNKGGSENSEVNKERSEALEIKETLFNGTLAVKLKDIQDYDIQEKQNMEENFSSLLIHLHNNPKNLYDALDQFFNDDQQVVVMQEYGPVKKNLALKVLPDILQIQIQRVEFDKQRLIPVKNIFQLNFPEQLFLDRYVSGYIDEDTLKKYKILNERLMFLREKRRNLLRKACGNSHSAQPLALRSSISLTLKHLQSELYEDSMKFDDSELKKAIKCLSGMKDHIDSKIQALDDEISAVSGMKDAYFDSFTKFQYSLFAIFMHRGEANYGHYWIYIKDGTVWRKYNDEEVVQVECPEEEIFNFSRENEETAYYLAYVRTDKISELIKPLDREIVE